LPELILKEVKKLKNLVARDIQSALEHFNLNKSLNETNRCTAGWRSAPQFGHVSVHGSISSITATNLWFVSDIKRYLKFLTLRKINKLSHPNTEAFWTDCSAESAAAA